jgi:hypothetical protein
MNVYGLTEVDIAVVTGVKSDPHPGRARGGFDVDSGQGKPGAVIARSKELDFAPQPLSLGRLRGSIYTDQFRRSGVNECRSEDNAGMRI